MPANGLPHYHFQFVKAFPAALRLEVLAAVSEIPPRVADVSSPISSLRRQIPIFVNGEQVDVPYRIHSPEPPIADNSRHLSPVQETIIDCLYTRHHDGFIRQRRLRRAAVSEESWAVPFVLALVSEYVVEILDEVRRALGELDLPGSAQRRRYGEFVAANPEFIGFIRQRLRSYWHTYYRSVYSWSDYPGVALMASLDGARAEFGSRSR